MDIQYEIERKAYELFEKNGSVCGCELEHWLEAERMVCATLAANRDGKKPAVKKTAAKPATKKAAAITSPKASKTAGTLKHGDGKTTPKSRKNSSGKQVSL